MRSKEKRSGLALGAVVALLAGLFGGVPAAQAANENAPVITPTVGTGYGVLVTDDFQLFTRLGSGQAGSDTWSYEISKSTTSANLIVEMGPAGASTASDYVRASLYSSSALVGWTDSAAIHSQLRLYLDGTTSVSTQVSVTVTPYQDRDNNHVKSNGDIIGDSVTVVFYPWSQLGTAVTLDTPIESGVTATASFTVTSGAVNYQQLDSTFAIVIESTNDSAASTSGRVTGSGIVSGNYSLSGAVAVAAFVATTPPQSLSAKVTYAGGDLTAETKVAVTPRTIAGVTVSAVTGANVKQTGALTADARVNSAFKLNLFPHTDSITTSVAVATAWSVSAVGSSMDFDANSGVIIGGVTYTSSATLLAAKFTQPAGTTTIDVSTFGQDTPDGSATLTFKGISQLYSKTLTVTLKAASYTATYTPTNVAGPAGTARSFTLDVKDNWAQPMGARTDHRVAASVKLGASTSDTVSALVSGGKATVVVTPVPATRTGSAVVSFTLQKYNQDAASWDKQGDVDTATWNVYAASTADGFVSRTASVSSSISYGVALSYSGTIAVVVNNSFSEVVASAPGLVIQDADDTSATASDTLTVQATNKTANFAFAATKTGTYVVTFTNGTATTTSEIVVDAAPSNKGATITFDTTQITPGKTKVITGTVRDANGNPVNTTRAGEVAGDSGTASILVTYTGDAGIVVGTMPTETDADGNFTLAVLTSAADRGTLTITATYMKAGAATATADKVTVIQAVNVGPATAAASADQKITVGTFKGYVAIYTKGYMGQKLSAKVAGKWLVVDPIAAYKSNDYSRTVRLTGAGYTITVDLYIDGAFVRSEVVTTK